MALLILPNTISFSLLTTPPVVHGSRTRTRFARHLRFLAWAASSESEDDKNASSQKSTKLVTFLGKGGSGKTTSAVFAAQHFAMTGFSTCLVIHTQDPTAEFLLNCKIGNSPTLDNRNLSALRFGTTQIVGEELGVLPGMDPIFFALALERLVEFFRNVAQKNRNKDKFDVIISDGLSSEMLLMIGAASKARLYLKYLRNAAEKTDLGRLAGPSVLRLVDEAMSISSSTLCRNGKISAEIWDILEQMLKRRSSAFSEPQKFGSYLVVDPDNPASVTTALRCWGCSIQAGAQVSGAFAIASRYVNTESEERTFSPLPFAFILHLLFGFPLDGNAIILNAVNENARNLLSLPASGSSSKRPQ